MFTRQRNSGAMLIGVFLFIFCHEILAFRPKYCTLHRPVIWFSSPLQCTILFCIHLWFFSVNYTQERYSAIANCTLVPFLALTRLFFAWLRHPVVNFLPFYFKFLYNDGLLYNIIRYYFLGNLSTLYDVFLIFLCFSSSKTESTDRTLKQFDSKRKE